ncbi:MAG TPA: PLP-dependent transferase, partial [Burkholderiales bacterium]|nr:PLP-dependent transferase [Burkholderiales bacterium]
MVLRAVSDEAIARFVDGLQLFGIGSSWGGYESLVTVARVEPNRTATRWRPGGPTVRLHIGLEDPDDLIADLEQAFARMRTA